MGTLLKPSASFALIIILMDGILGDIQVASKSRTTLTGVSLSQRPRHNLHSHDEFAANRSPRLSAVTDKGSLKSFPGAEPPVLSAPGLATTEVNKFARGAAAALLSLKASLQATEVSRCKISIIEPFASG